MRVLPIKDLKDLSVFFRSAGYYRHAGPKGPEEIFFAGVIAGDRPPRYGPGKGFSSPCAVRDQALPNYSLLLLILLIVIIL